MRICIMGGASRLIQPVIKHYLDGGNEVTAVCHNRVPTFDHENLYLLDGVDLSNIQSSEFKLSEVENQDALILAAGKSISGRIESTTSWQWRQAIESNLYTAISVLRFAHNLLPGGGNIVILGSITGSIGGFGCAGYAAAKAGLVGLARSASLELASSNIRVNVLELGYFDTGMGEDLPEKVKNKIRFTIPMQRFGNSSDLIDAMDFLVKTNYMTGNVLTLAGGLR